MQAQYYYLSGLQNFDNDAFRSEIQSFCSLNETDLGLFKESIFCIFNKHAPIRKKYLRANEAPFITKETHNAIMKRSRYRKKFLKGKSQTSRENYKIQRNLCKKLLKKTKISYFESLNTKKSQKIEPSGKLLFLFSQKRRQKVKRLLMKQKFLMIKNIHNNFFSNVVSDLKIPNYCNYFSPQKYTFSLNETFHWNVSLKRLKNTPVFLILKKGILIQYFHSESLLKMRYRKLSGI